jgi:hypothetical protein
VSVIRYRGRSGLLYGWDLGVLPAALLDTSTSAAGVPVQQGTWNGETVVRTNSDGSVARSVKGGPPAGDPFSFTVLPSPWESLV